MLRMDRIVLLLLGGLLFYGFVYTQAVAEEVQAATAPLPWGLKLEGNLSAGNLIVAGALVWRLGAWMTRMEDTIKELRRDLLDLQKRTPARIRK